MDEGARLEIAYPERGRGFKSLSLRIPLVVALITEIKELYYSDIMTVALVAVDYSNIIT